MPSRAARRLRRPRSRRARCPPTPVALGPRPRPLAADRSLKPAIVRAVARMNGSLSMDAATTDALRTLLDESRHRRLDAPDRRQVGHVRRAEAEAEQRGDSSSPASCVQRDQPTIGAPRSPPACSPCRPARRGARRRSRHARRPARVRRAQDAADHDARRPTPGADTDAAMINVLAHTRVDADLRSDREAARVGERAPPRDEGGTITPAQLGPANVARLRTHPESGLAQQAVDAPRRLTPSVAAARRSHCGAHAGGREAGRRRQGQGAVHRAPARAATSSATSARTSDRR